jgi:carbon monoxide dehydrogenase subunit G
MLHFEGQKQFLQTAAELVSKFSDARFLVSCVPDVVSVTATSATEASCVLRPGLSFVRGTLEVAMRVAESAQDQPVTISLHSKGIGSSSDVEAVLRFTPTDVGTTVDWTADVKQLGGLLKAVPQGLIQAAANKVINDAWNSVEAKLR